MIDARWVAFFLAAVVVTVNTIWFVSGRRRSIAVAIYTNAGLPAIARNLPVVSPVLTIVAWTLLILTAPAALHLRMPPDVESGVGRQLSLAMFGYAFAAVSLVILLAYSPPQKLHPKWLVSLGYQRPPTTSTDRLVLVVVGIPGFVVGVGILLIAWL